MSEGKKLDPEQLAQVAGGECTAEQAATIIANLTDTYEQLIDFAGYVMARVAGDPPAQT